MDNWFHDSNFERSNPEKWLEKARFEYKKLREATQELRDSFGHPDSMSDERRTGYVEKLKQAATVLARIRMHLGNQGHYIVAAKDSVDDFKDIRDQNTIIDKLVDEFVMSKGQDSERRRDLEEYIRKIMTDLDEFQWEDRNGVMALERPDDFEERSDEEKEEIIRRNVAKELRQRFYTGLFWKDAWNSKHYLEDYDPYIIDDILMEAQLPSPGEYLWRKLTVLPIVVKGSAHPRLRNLTQAVASLLLLGHWDAAIILCRSLVEDTLKELGERQRMWVQDYREPLADWFERIAAEIVPERQYETSRVTELINLANAMVHGSEPLFRTPDEAAFSYVLRCFEVVEFLLERGGSADAI